MGILVCTDNNRDINPRFLFSYGAECLFTYNLNKHHHTNICSNISIRNIFFCTIYSNTFSSSLSNGLQRGIDLR